LIIERRGQDPPGLGQHARVQLGGLDRGDVLDHRHRGDEPPAPVADRRRLQQSPGDGPVGVDDAHQQRHGILARDDLDPREVLDGQRPAVLVFDLEAGHHLAPALAAQFVECRHPHRRQRRPIGIDDHPAAVADRDRFGEDVEEGGHDRRLHPREDVRSLTDGQALSAP